MRHRRYFIFNVVFLVGLVMVLRFRVFASGGLQLVQDSNGQGNNVSGVAVSYPPNCDAGVQQSFRVGDTGQLDGSGSHPLNGGTSLNYVWTQTAGPAVHFSSAKVAKPTITGMNTFGSYDFQLTVTDGSNQSASCVVHDGAAVTDANGVVATGDPALDILLGPLIHYGENPWPWFDDRAVAEAKLQIANMDQYYGDYWDVPASGTVTVSTGSATVTGNGTTFAETFCQGPESPTVPKSGASVIVWYPTNNPLVPGETGRRRIAVAGCESDTQLTLANAWYTDTSPGTGLHYTEQDDGNLTAWEYNDAPANYYDNVAAYYALYYRSGIDDYLNAARKLADRFWTSPEIDRGSSYTLNGSAGDTIFPGPFRSSSMMGLVLRALDGRPDMWPGLNKVWATAQWYQTVYEPEFGYVWDEREASYILATVSYCALFDPDPAIRSSCQATISTSVAQYWAPREQSDGSWPGLSVSSGWTGSVTLTKGSASVVGSGTAWTSAQSGLLIWFTNSSTQPSSNAGGDAADYTATVLDATHLTLDRPYAGVTGTHGWAMSSYGVVGYGSVPYMMGLMSEAFDFAAKSIADTDPANATVLHRYNVAAADWIMNDGYWPAEKGLYYFAGTVTCRAPISDTNTACTHDYDASQSRSLSALAMRGIAAAYQYSGDSTLKSFGDTLFSAMFSKPGTGGPNPDGSYESDLDDGGPDLSGTPPIGQAPKWDGIFFGFSDGAVWPAASVGGSSSSASVAPAFPFPSIVASTTAASAATSSSSSPPGGSATLTSLVSQIRSLAIQLFQASNNGGSLAIGSQGPDVWALQVFLSIDGASSASAKLAAIGPTGYFGSATQSALAEYQASVGIAPASGYFGPVTRASMNND